MDPIRKIPKKFTKKSGNKVINRQYFCRKTGLKFPIATLVMLKCVLICRLQIRGQKNHFCISLNAL